MRKLSRKAPFALLLCSAITCILTGCVIKPISPVVASSVDPNSACGAKREYVIIPAESRVSFFATEHWLKPEKVTDIVIGTTGLVTGSVTVDPIPPTSVRMSPIEVNLRDLTTHDRDLDASLRSSYLQANIHPIATFTTQKVVGLPERCSEGTEIKFQVEGELSIRKVSKQVRFDVVVQLDGDRLLGTASTQVRMTMFGISPPSKIGISTVENEVTIECEFTAVAAQHK